MRTPSTKYLYGFTSTFGANVNVTAADYDAVDAEIAAERLARLTDSAPAAPAPVPVQICAWCPDFNPRLSQGLSHGICPACEAQLEEAERLAREDEELRGSRCSASCGWCGACS